MYTLLATEFLDRIEKKNAFAQDKENAVNDKRIDTFLSAVVKKANTLEIIKP